MQVGDFADNVVMTSIDAMPMCINISLIIHSPDNNGVNVEEGPGLGCMLVFSPIILGGKVLRALSEGPLPAQDQSHLSDRQMEHHSEVRHKLEQQPYNQFKCLPQS